MTNLIDYADDLNEKQLAFLVRVVNQYGNLPSTVHKGSILFVNRALVIMCLRIVLEVKSQDTDAHARYAKKLLNKFGVKNTDETVTFQMFLNTKKLARLAAYSTTEEVGTLNMRLPFKVTREVGLQWQEFGKKWISPEVDVNYFLQLRKLKGDLYEIQAPKKIEVMVKDFLFSNYAAEV